MPSRSRALSWLLYVLLTCAVATLTFVYGFVASKYQLPLYASVEGGLESVRDTALVRYVRYWVHKNSADRRLRDRKATAVTDADVTVPSDLDVDALRALGYLQGYEPAGERSGTTVYVPDLAYDGLNLVTDGHRPRALLMDMEGRELHRWAMPYDEAFPDISIPTWYNGTKSWRRVKLLEGGDLLAIFEGNGLIRVDRDSNLRWANSDPFHHDVEVMPDGRLYALARRDESVPSINELRSVGVDYIVVLGPDGKEQRRVSVLAAIQNSPYASLLDHITNKRDILHTNDLEVLRGRLADEIPAFQEGNVLVSLHGLNALAVIDMDSEQVVWALSGLFVRQHNPTVLDNGHLLVFDNLGDHGYSRVVEFDPLTLEMRWIYSGRRHGFHTETCGSNQRLPNGNTLVTESESGRAFEVTPDATIVWEYYTPNRVGEDNDLIATLFDVVRIPPDHPMGWLSSSTSRLELGSR